MPGQQQLYYGHSGQLELDIPPESIVAHCGEPHGEALDDPLAAVAASLVDPYDYPPLASATVPGDRIVIAVNHGVPQVASLVGGIVQSLADGPVSGRDIRILLAPGSDYEALIKRCLPEKMGAEIRIQVHDPERGDQMAYLAASSGGEPIMMNRRLCDADMVIPVGCLRPAGAWGATHATLGVFPTFADVATSRRLQAMWESPRKGQSSRHAAEIDEATWLLGNRFTVQAISAAGDQLLHVLSGDIDAVGRVGGQLAARAWEFRVPRRARVVVATISGGADQQSWENVTRAIFAASRAVDDNGAIVVCTELRDRPGLDWRHTMASLADSATEEDDSWSDDLGWASRIRQSMTPARIYLMSKLRDDLVEDMGMAPVHSAKEIANLCRRLGNCLLLANSQHALPVLSDDD